MEPELKALIDKAVAGGATKEELRVIMMDYYGVKKKGATSGLGLDSGMDSSESTSLPSAGTRKDGGGSGSPTVESPTEYRFQGRSIPESDARLIGQYADNHEAAYKDYIEKNFSLDTYYSYSPDRLSALAEYSEADREATRKDLIENILSSGSIYEEEVQDEILLGIDSGYSEKMSASLQTARSIAHGAYVISGPGLALIEGDDAAEDRVEATKKELTDRYSSEARVRLNNEIAVDTSERVRSLLPKEQQDNPEELRELERHVYAEYQIPLDLDGSGYINDKEGRVHAVADSWDSFIASSYELGSIVGIAADDFAGKILGDTAAGKVQRNLANWHRMEQQFTSRRLREDVRIPLQTISQKVESGDISGALADGLVMTGDSMPMMLAAIGTGAITRSPVATASAVSLVGGATTYNSVRDEKWFNELNTIQQSAYISANGIAEGLPALVGANIFNRFRKLAIAGVAGKKSTGDLVKGFLMATPLGMVEEGLTEGVTAGVQYLTTIAAQDKEFNSEDFNRSVKDGWWGGVIMAGTLGGAGMAAGGGLRGAQLAFTSMPALRNKLEIKRLEKEFAKEKTTSGRAIIGQKLAEAVQSGARLEKKKRAFYEFLEEASPEAYSQIVALQKEISKLSVQHNRVDSESERKRISGEIQALVSKRSEIEAQYDSEFDLNSKAETSRILAAVAEVDNNYLQYGELFEEGSDSTEVTAENVDAVSDAIEKAGMFGLNLKLPLGIGKITTPEAVKKGLQNAMAVVKAISKQKGFKKMVIHRTLASMQNATKSEGASGMWFGSDTHLPGEIHILAPALNETTAYHEGYHNFVVQELGEGAAKELAKKLEKGLSGELRKKYQAFLADYVLKAGKQFYNLAAAIADPNFDFADEFLVEILADITNKDVGIEYKRGLVRKFTDFVASGLGKIGVSGIPTAKLDDLVKALETMTGQVREGEAPSAIEDVSKAAKRMGYKGSGGALMDEEDGDTAATAKKAQGPLAVGSEKKAFGDPALEEKKGRESFLKVSGKSEDQLTERKKELKAKLEKKFKDDKRLKRNPEVLESLEKYAIREITFEEYIEIVRSVTPIKAFETSPGAPSTFDIGAAVDSNKLDKGIIGKTKDIPDGYYVALRLDIPAYNNFDVWVVSVHQGTVTNATEKTASLGGKSIGYAQTGLITNVEFGTIPKAAFNIAKGKAKTPIARMFGSWQNHSSEDVNARAEAIMKSKEYNKAVKEAEMLKAFQAGESFKMKGWIQVGMNPFRHSWFYDKRDGRPVVSASEAIQVGALVLAKDAEKVSYDDQRFEFYTKEGERVKFQNPLGSVEGEGFVGPRPRGEFVTAVRGATEQRERIGQGFAHSEKNKVQVVKPESNNGTIDISIKGLREANEKLYIKNAEFLAQLDIVRATRKFRESTTTTSDPLTYADEIYEVFVEEVKDNLLWLHDQFDPVLREVSTLWYDGANIISNELAKKFNVPPSNVAAVIAALSPQKDWFQNVRLAEMVLEVMSNHSDAVVSEEMIEYMEGIEKPKWAEQLRRHKGKPIGELPGIGSSAIAVWAYADVNLSKEYSIISPDGTRGGAATNKDGSNKVAAWGSTAMIEKAIRAVGAKSMKEISELLGTKHKIRNFFNNINAPSNGSDATIDTHAVGASHLKPFASSDAEVDINFGGTKAYINRAGELFTLKQMRKASGLKAPSAVEAWAKKKGYRVINAGSSAPTGFSGTYFAYLDAYRAAAKERGLLPREMQSITWEAVRLLYTEGFKTSRNKGEIETLHRQYTDGEITKDQLRDELLKKAGGIGSPSWEPLIRPKLQRISGQAPYGGNVFGGSDGAGPKGTGAGRGASDKGLLSGKSQGDLTRLIANFLDKQYPNPKVKVDKRKKNPVSFSEGSQTALFSTKKKEIIKMLLEHGLNAETAQAVYQNAKAYKEGRTIGKREAMRVAKKAFSEGKKLSTEARNLRKELELIRDKSKTVNEFIKQAIVLVKERMEETSKVPFTKGQITKLIKIIRGAHKTSAKRVEAEGMDAMQTFIDRISSIFDQQDAKLEMQRYLKGVSAAKRMQARLGRMSRKRGRGEAMKNTSSYTAFAKKLSKIKVEFLPREQLGLFVNVMAGTIDSMTKATAVWDADLEGFEGVSSMKVKAEDLANLVSNFEAMAELGRKSVMISRAHRQAAINGTSFEEELDELTKAYERGRLSSSRKAILKFIDDNPTIKDEQGNDIVLDSGNPAHIELITKALAVEAAKKETLKKEAIINDVLIPRIAANIDKLLEDPHIPDILGIYHASDLNLDVIRERLMRLDRHQVINLDYQLDNYIVNDSSFGIGYLHSMVRGQLDFPSKLGKLILGKKLVSYARKRKVSFAIMDTLDSFLRNAVLTDNVTFAKVRSALGFTDMEAAFAKADFIHSSIVQALEDEVKRIEAGGKGSVSKKYDRAVMQVYSMLKQLPEFEGSRRDAEALWYLEVQKAMARTIKHYKEESSFTENEVKEFEEAMEFVFGDTTNLAEAVKKVESQRGDLVEMVQWFAGVHSNFLPQFRDYVERYLGKELVVEDNYTAFEVIPATGARSVDDLLSLRLKMQSELLNSSLSQSKKVAGSSFERNPRSLKGEARIGLDFLAANERTIRDNVILTHTVGSIMAMSHALNSKEAKDLFPEKIRKELERKAMAYVKQDTSEVPQIFSTTSKIFGMKVPNPLNMLRNAVVVKFFGGFLQIPKQATVLTSVMFQAKHPLHSIPFLTESIAEMTYYTFKTGGKDGKLVLEDGKYKLLQGSPVFQRDYAAGNIDPFTGRMSLDEVGFVKVQRFLTDISLKPLKETDKIAAVASWFTYYGDVLIEMGAADSFSEINWDAEALKPNQDALSYANTMVAKDQAASTPRQAADLYSDGKGSKAAIGWMLRNILLPFSRHTVNKKRAVSSDMKRMWFHPDPKVKKEAAIAFVGTVTEFTLFHSINVMLVPLLASMVMGDDDDEQAKVPKNNSWYTLLGRVLVDLNPLPPMTVIDDTLKGFLNRYVVYPYDIMNEGDFNLGDDDGYERWLRVNGGIPVFYKGKPKSQSESLLRFFGPYGDYVNDAHITLLNVVQGGKKIVSPNGDERYVRPEDRDAMMMYYLGKSLLTGSQLMGFSNKEIDLLIGELDNLPKERKLNNEEELAAFEMVAEAYGKKLVKGEGEDRIRAIIDGKENPFDQRRAFNSFRGRLKPHAAEFEMKRDYPEEHKRHMREVRAIMKRLKNAKDYHIYLRGKKESLPPEEFSDFKEFLGTYTAMTKPSFYTEGWYLETLEE